MHRLIKKELKTQDADIRYFFNRAKIGALVHQSYDNIIRYNKKIIRGSSVIMTGSYGVPKSLSKFGLRDRFVVFTRHGTGDRKYTFHKDLYNFDLVFIPSKKMYQQFKELGILNKLRAHLLVEYSKFDYLFYHENDPPLNIFANDLPIILYNPHYDKKLSSFYNDSERIITTILDSEKYNIILSPHPLINTWFFKDRIKKRYPKSERLHKDWSSFHKVNFDYMKIADLYLGDISSSVYEWLYFDKPIIFYNSHNIQWKNNPYHKYWELGEVVSDVQQLMDTLEKTFQGQNEYGEVRIKMKDYTFGRIDGKASYRAAYKLYNFLKINRV
jgi:CDP-glycerol glycerophosphotransferase (TagB/SpsB family)